MKTIVTAATLALGLAAGTNGAPAQAEPAQTEIVWHFPYKGSPYATRTVKTRNVVFEHHSTQHSVAQRGSTVPWSCKLKMGAQGKTGR